MEKNVSIKNASGLHARPAGMFVKKAAEFKSTVEVIAKGKTVNALKSEMRNTISERDIEANIMWLLKNGFARLQKEI